MFLYGNAFCGDNDKTDCKRAHVAIAQSIGMGTRPHGPADIAERLKDFAGQEIGSVPDAEGGMNYVFRVVDGDKEVAIRVPIDPTADMIDIAKWEYELRLSLAEAWKKTGREGRPPLLIPTGFHEPTGATQGEWVPETVHNRLGDSRFMGPKAPEGAVYGLWGKIADAVQFLHDSDVVHRDLKAANVHLVVLYKDPETGLTSSKGSPTSEVSDIAVLLGDFDLSAQQRTLNPTVDGISGTAAYMPVDQIFQKTPVPAHDVFAMRKLFAEIALGDKITSEEMASATFIRGLPFAKMTEFRHSLEDKIGPYKAMVVHHPTKSVKELKELAAFAEKFESSGTDPQKFVKAYAKKYLLPLMERDPERAAEVIFTSKLLTDAFRQNLGQKGWFFGMQKRNGLGMNTKQSKELLAALAARYGGIPKRESYTLSLDVPLPEETVAYRAPNPFVEWDEAHLAIADLKMESEFTYVDPRSVGILPIVDGNRAPRPDVDDDAPTRITRPRAPQN